jgi:hypothetical protein
MIAQPEVTVVSAKSFVWPGLSWASGSDPKLSPFEQLPGWDGCGLLQVTRTTHMRSDTHTALVIALSIMAASWAVAICAILFDAGLAILWRALLIESIVGGTELLLFRRRNKQ